MTDQTSSPLVSVILPTRNRAQFLARALKSVLAQTYTRFEVILIDEGSSDSTPEIVQSFNDSRIRHLRHEVVRGPGGARNIGFQAAGGELVAFLDDDDEYFPDKLKTQVRTFNESLSSVGLVYNPVRTLRDGQPLDLFPVFEESGNIFLQYLSSFPFPLQSSMIRKEAFIPFDEKLACLEDVDFLLRILQTAKAVYAPGVCALCHLDKKRKRVGENPVAVHHAFRTLEGRYFDDPADSFLVDAHADLLIRFAKRLFTLGYEDEAARGYVDRAFRVKKDRRRLFYKMLNNLGPGMLKTFMRSR